MSEARRTALAFRDAGISFVSILLDGTKKPDRKWKEFQQRIPTAAEVDIFFGGREAGIAAIAGKVSGNLEILDFDDPETFERWQDVMTARNPFLLARLVVIDTPGPGVQLWYRSDVPVGGNQKLAARRDAGGKIVTLVETRGEGGYAVAPGSPVEVHATKRPYQVRAGDPARPPVLDPADRETLLECARALNEYVAPKEWAAPEAAAPTGAPQGNRPGDDYNARGDVLALLLAHQWTVEHRVGDVLYLGRPGKAEPGWSATLNRIGPGGLFVFSTSAAPFDAPRGYKPFSVYALLEHGGDITAAARALGEQGYGEPARVSSRPPLPGDSEAPPDSNGRDTAEQVQTLTRRENALKRQLEGMAPTNGTHVAPVPFSFLKGLTAARLQEMSYPELVWPVPELICEGFTLTSGREKMGKSRLFEEMAVAIAMGQRVFGVDEFRAIQGDVLLLALEEEERLIQERLRQWLGASPWPENLTIFTEWPRQGENPGAVEFLDRWMEYRPKTSFILLDTFRRVRAIARRDSSVYDEDSRALQPFHDFTKRHPGLSLTMVHHSNKLNAEDDHDTISGSTGLAAVPDRVMVLRRKRGDAVATLSFSGRRGRWRKIRLRDDLRTGTWIYEGEADETFQQPVSPDRFAIIEALTGKWLTATELAHTLGKTDDKEYNSLRKLLTKMKESGVLVNGGGKWSVYGTGE